jgi:predicted RecB family nuclease
MSPAVTEQQDFALDQYAITSCPVALQHYCRASTDTPTPLNIADMNGPPARSTHYAHVVRTLTTRHMGQLVDLTLVTDTTQRTARAHAAMESGTPLIVGAQLDTDWARHHSGRVDLLVKADTATPTYSPVLIKDYLLLNIRERIEGGHYLSAVSQPFFHQAVRSHHALRIDSHLDDLLHLAHLRCLLETMGYATVEPWAGVIGTDHAEDVCPHPECPHKGHVITWINLTDKLIRTFSSTSTPPWRKYSPLDRYAHESRFRVRVVKRALAGDEPVVRPIRTPDCDECRWWENCRETLRDDISFHIDHLRLDPREITTLRSLGVTTITDLGEMDVDGLLERYLPQVAHRPGGEERLRLAAHRGRLLSAGVSLERLTPGPIDIPSADIEIDWDIETSSNRYAYLWGFLIHDRRDPDREPTYHSVHNFALNGPLKELALAEEALGWLKDFVSSQVGASVLVYHYSSSEVTTVRRLSEGTGRRLRALAWFHSWRTEHCVDLHPYVQDNFFSVEGLGLKTVASVGAGFAWRDTDPGGLNSQHWLDEALSCDDAERQQAIFTRLLDYNEDDVRATWALRGWLRSLS